MSLARTPSNENSRSKKRFGFGGDDDEDSPFALNKPVIWIVGLAVLSFALFITSITFIALYARQKTDSSSQPKWPDASFSPYGRYAKAGVAADNIYCSEIGRNILLQGGNAIDAAIAALFCIGVHDCHSAGLGGGHYMTIYNATTKECIAIDARQTAPLAATRDMYKNDPDGSTLGWRAVSVPGEIHGYWTEFTNFGSGKVSWAQLVQPTIDILVKGQPVSSSLANALREKVDDIMKDPTLKHDFTNPKTGKVYTRGELITTRERLANTLMNLRDASDPVQVFYNGLMTQNMVQEFKDRGGIITMKDFQNYRTKVTRGKDVLTTQLRNNYVMCGAPPPSSAAIAMAIISIVDGYDFDKTKDDDLELFFHRYIEASKFAYASRSWLGDPAFVANSTQIAMNITSKQWADWIRTRITDVTHDTDYYGGSFGPSDTHGTTNIAIIDADGNAVSVTSTINLFFGAKVASPSTGVVWNDEMDDFSLPGRSNYFDFPPSPANYIEPGKRMMSSMSPIIIRNTKDERLYAIGGAGGSEISTTVALVASQCLRLDRTIKEALDSPRLHNQLLPNCTHYEGEFPSQFLDRLRNRGHTFCREDYEAVDTGVFRGESGYVYANSDWRKGAESSPAGY